MEDAMVVHEGVITDDYVPDTQPLVALKSEAYPINSTEVREKTLELKKAHSKCSAELCRMIWYIRKKKLYKSWGFVNFREYCNRELEFRGSMGHGYASLWERTDAEKDPSLFCKLMELGSAKAFMLLPLVSPNNSEQTSEWIKRGKELGADALFKEIRTHKKQLRPDDSPKEALANEQQVMDLPLKEEKKIITLELTQEQYMVLNTYRDHVLQENPEINLSETVTSAMQEALGSGSEDLAQALVAIDSICKRFGMKQVIFKKDEQGEIEFITGFDHYEELIDKSKEE